MIRKSGLLFSALVALTFLSCGRLVLKSTRIQDPIAIDGNDADWESVPLTRFDSWDVSLGLANDRASLYVLVYFENPMLLMEAGMRGMDLAIYTQDSHTPALRLHYTGADGPGSEHDPGPGDSFWMCLSGEQQKRFLEQQRAMKNQIVVTGGEKTDRIDPDGSGGVCAARIMRSVFSGYEWKIPISGNEKGLYTLNAGPGEPLDIRMHLGERNRNSAPGGPPGFAGMEGGPMERPGMPMQGGAFLHDGEVRLRVILADQPGSSR
ncbi:hypothetical protein JW948_00650 [bacterium]|nr:hypothetical protein [bacterium]